MGRKSLSYQRVYEQKLVSVVCEEVTDEDWTNGTVDHKLGRGKKCAWWIVQDVDSVEELVLSQESVPGTHKTIRQISQNIGVSKTTVHRIVN